MATIQNKEAWLAERRTGLGGSDIAKIFGLSKWGSAVDVWLDKRGEKEDQPESEAMKLGTVLEPYVAQRFTEETGKGLIEYRPTIHGNGEDAFALGNLDRIVVEDGQDMNEMVMRLQQGDLSCVESILECKTATKMDDWHDDHGNFTVPEYYRTQVLWYLGLVPSAKRIYVAVYYTGLSKGFEFGCVERNDALIAGMFDVARNWWKKHIVEGVMPETSTKEEVLELFPRSVDLSSKPTDDAISEAVAAYKRAKAEKDAAQDALDKAEDAIAAFLGENESLVSPDGKMLIATFKSSKDTVKDVTDWEGVAREMNATDDVVRRHTEFGKVTRRGSRPLKVLDTPKEIKAKKVA